MPAAMNQSLFKSILFMMTLLSVPAISRADNVVGLTNEVEETRERDFVFSSIGPGDGHTAIGLGVQIMLILPTVDFRLAHGLSEHFDLVANVNTLGILTVGDVGVRAHWGAPAFSLGVKAAANTMLIFLGNAGSGGVIGAGPGVFLSTGGASTQLTLGVDVPMYFAGAAEIQFEDNSRASGAGVGFSYLLKPTLAVEFKVGDSTNLYIALGGLVDPNFDAELPILPTLSIGAAW